MNHPIREWFDKPRLDSKKNSLMGMRGVSWYLVRRAVCSLRRKWISLDLRGQYSDSRFLSQRDSPKESFPEGTTLWRDFGKCFLGGFSEIEVMQPVRYCHSFNPPIGLDCSRFRGVFVQPQVSPLIMVVVKISLQTFPQMIVIHDDQVIKTFPPDAPDESFAISILPRGPIGG